MERSLYRYVLAPFHVFHRSRFARNFSFFAFRRRVFHTTRAGACDARVTYSHDVIQDVNVHTGLWLHVFVYRDRRFNGVAKRFNDLHLCLSSVGHANHAICEGVITFFRLGAVSFCNLVLVVSFRDSNAKCTTFARATYGGNDVQDRAAADDRGAFDGDRADRILEKYFSASRCSLLSIDVPFYHVVNRRRSLPYYHSQEYQRTFRPGFHLFLNRLIRCQIGRFVRFVQFSAFRYYLLIGRALVRRISYSFGRYDANAFSIANLRRPRFSFLRNRFRVLRVVVVIFRLYLRFIRLPVSFQRNFFR